jgi:hypothetical protein
MIIIRDNNIKSRKIKTNIGRVEKYQIKMILAGNREIVLLESEEMNAFDFGIIVGVG